MGRQPEAEGTFTRPHTCTHTFIRLGAVGVEVEGGREASDESPEVLVELRLGDSVLMPWEPVDGYGGGGGLPRGKCRQHQLVDIVQTDVSALA